MSSRDESAPSQGPSENRRPEPGEPATPDRVYRSPGAIVGGVLLLGLGIWMGGDALFRGSGMTPWLVLAAMIAVVPLVVAFTLRPAVYANNQRMRVRNPFRTIVLPWAAVDAVRAGYSCEVLSGSEKYQLWSIPVSLRARKSANRERAKAEAARAKENGNGNAVGRASAAPPKDHRAAADQAVDDLRELASRHAREEGAQGAVEVRWAYEVLVPMAAGAILLVVLGAVA
ncbi:PH domain-containing protein [Streptomyces sp. KLOTTS4A1]|uniref:PH domain-containing protein n=1 Tax=Streptomyces sp. KLOTTS4A1 TaxID=3390996 RepID=UPI0039F4E244